ncbi:hypothetical protein JCM17843_03700 [Kordiimonadales bacterium JCM 17843]|nr:hypothetical protein JCM17843_03700 [Kordiimonadales bacterium JCM 17843]
MCNSLPMVILCRIFLLSLLLWALNPVSAGAEDVKAADIAPIYIQFAPISVPLMQGGYVQGSFHIRVELAVTSEKNKEAVDRMMPRLESAYLMSLVDLSRYVIRADEPADLVSIGAALQQSTNDILGPEKARVLISEAAVRR